MMTFNIAPNMKNLNFLLKESLQLIFISAILGITAQTILPNGIGLKTEITVINSDSSNIEIPTVTISPNGEFTEPSSISLSAAFSAYEEGNALFLDARDQFDYEQGHILGAINLPVSAFLDSLPMLENLDQDQVLITYCDGVDCNASIDLAASLELMGFSKLFFFNRYR